MTTNKTVYQTVGASLTFPESEQMLEWVNDTVSKQEHSMRESMERRGYNNDSKETAAMIDKVRIHTLKAIAKARPELFKFGTNHIGDKLLEIWKMEKDEHVSLSSGKKILHIVDIQNEQVSIRLETLDPCYNIEHRSIVLEHNDLIGMLEPLLKYKRQA